MRSILPKTGMYIDFKIFDKNFKKIVEKTIPGKGEEGLSKGASELLIDARDKPPQAPKDIGDLWGSILILKPYISRGEIGIQCGFNIIYAARWHEATGQNINWTTDKGASQPGPKFLESKMSRYMNKYMAIVAKAIE